MNAIATHKINIRAKDMLVAYSDFVALKAKALDITGGVIAVVGHNGAGKSTFLKALLDLLPPQTGSLAAYTLGNPEQKLVAEKDMAFCPETGSVFADISVESYVKLWCRLKHHNAKYYRKEGSRYIDALYLSPLFNKLGRELSKGQRRRVQTAIGFLCNPRLFLFDEPFDGLDIQKTRELASLIEAESGRMSFIVSSHRMDVIERISDAVIVIREGEFAATGSIASVCSSLCPVALRISGSNDFSKLESTLKAALPGALTSIAVDSLEIRGAQCIASDLPKIIAQSAIAGLSITEVKTSLVDAMDYHLSGLDQAKSHAA